MADKTGISWTEATWNPIVGCSVVSPGCTNCYAMKQAARISHMQPHSHYFSTTRVINGNAVWTGGLVQAPEHILTQPLRWTKPRMIFVNSMSDLFHEEVPDKWIDWVFSVMARCPQHTFQILTKRSKRMQEYMHAMRGVSMMHGQPWPLPNVWLGVSCEDQQRADERIPDLLATPAKVRFVSAEPLLSGLNIFWAMSQPLDIAASFLKRGQFAPGLETLQPLDWVIAGGESGPGHRPMQIEWAEAIMRQCKDAGTAFFFKQDSGAKSGLRGRASDELWACKEFPANG